MNVPTISWIQNFLGKAQDFLTIKEKSLWQEVFVTSISIPIIIWIAKKISKWFTAIRPGNLLLKGCRQPNDVLIFLSQFSVADVNFKKDSNPKLVVPQPAPLPGNKSNFTYRHFHNIDPVWSESDGRCAADVFNVLGRVGKTQNVRVAEIVKDWDKRGTPIFSIGGNPKTHDLLNECEPIHFSGLAKDFLLKIEGHEIALDPIVPNDAGVIQKTFFKQTEIPVFILAGLGTVGTEATGYFFAENFIDLGKLYGNKPFCVLLKANILKGRTFYEAKGMYPQPSLSKAALYPITFYKWKKKKVFPMKRKKSTLQ